MLTKLKYRFRGYIKRREDEAAFKAFIAGMQYGEYLAKKEMKAK
jgi:hypothetical protein